MVISASLEILTPSARRMTCVLTSFRTAGKMSPADNPALATRLLDQFGIFAVERDGLARGACIRVTPGIFAGVDVSIA